MQLSEAFPIETGTRKHENPTLNLRVDGIPINGFFVPVLIDFTTKEDFHGPFVFLVGDDKQVVIGFQNSLCGGHNDLVATPNTRDNELQMGHMRHVNDAFFGRSRVDYFEFGNVSVVVTVHRSQCKVGRFDEACAQNHHRNNHAQDTQGIGNRGGKCHGSVAHS